MSLRLSESQARRLLAFVFILAALYQAGSSAASIDVLRHGTTQARAPMLFGFRLEEVSGVLPEAESAGVKRADVLEQVDGEPFSGELVLDRIIGRKNVGDSTHCVLRRQDGTRFAAKIKLAPIRPTPASLAAWIVTPVIETLLPAFCLALGFWVAFARPCDRLAWLLLALMIGFSQMVGGFSWSWPLMWLAILWNALTGQAFGVWLIWLVLFGLYFPERAEFDRRLPFLKWILLAPLTLLSLLFIAFALGSDYNFRALYPLRPLLRFLIRVPLYTYLAFTAISAFFALLGFKGGKAQGDAKRRLRILYWGTAASLTPLFILAIVSVVRHQDIFLGIPDWARIFTLLMLLLFPLTMAYVIVVQRAMEVGVVVRQGVRYALARRSLQIFRAVILIVAIVFMQRAFSDEQPGVTERIAALLLLAAVIALRGRYSKRLTQVIDRRFFREAYSAEVLMSELAQETRRFTEAEPLLTTVTKRIAATLHISRMSVFLRDQDRFCVAQTIGPQPHGVSCLSQQGRSVGLLEQAKKPELVYFDDPRSWVHGAPPDEQQKLRGLHAEVLLALPGRSQLLGLIALGPKLSEQPYSSSDLNLLQSVAVQTGLALENTQLLAAVASEAGKRERLNREMEIAREVQERLLPQSRPPVAGVDYCGLCRPALAVGGDYFDYIPCTGGRLGLALGDVSGKGISAALMMASLQSLLRGQLAAGLDNVATLLTNTNRLIYDVSTSNRYVTFFYGEFDPATRRLLYVNAGHNPPIILRGDEVIRLEACGPVVGLLRSVAYESAEFQFESGDILIAFTDGISEAMTVEDEEWGDDRLIEAARACYDENASGMTKSIMRAADTFTAGAEQHDDMTVIVWKLL